MGMEMKGRYAIRYEMKGRNKVEGCEQEEGSIR